jgi:hypothetical protein
MTDTMPAAPGQQGQQMSEQAMNQMVYMSGPEQAQKLSKEESQKILADCEKKFKLAKDQRVSFERDWYYNMAFYFGRQWVEWVGTATNNFEFYKLYEPPAPKWRVRLVVNKIRPVIRKELTKLSKERLQYYVVPNTTEDKDITSSRAAEAISEYLFQELGFEPVKRRTVFWALICGSAFIKTYYDPDKPDSSGVPGSVCLDPINAFHLFAPDLEEEEIENQPYVIHAAAKDADWVKGTYGLEAETDVSSTGLSLEQRFFSALGIASATSRELVYVKEMWVKPCPNYPAGAVIIWAGEQILSLSTTWPYQNMRYPFSKIDHIPTGRFYAESVIKDLIPIQKEYNRTVSQIIEAKNRMARPQLIAPKGSIDPQKMTSEPGLIILYQPGMAPPQPIPLAQLPSYVENSLERMSRDMDDNVGQFEVTNGRTPPGVEAASAIAYLQEESDTRLAHTVSSIEEAVEKTGKAMLSLVDQFWDAQRLVKVTGVNNMLETFEFSKSDVAGNTDFRVQAGSGLPRSRAAKQAFLTELGKLGWIQPDRILRYMDMVETNKLYEDSQVSVRQAQRENIRMRDIPPEMMQQMQQMQQQQPQVDPATGQPIPPPPIIPTNEFDDDAVHVEEHQRFMRTQEYEILPPEIQQNFTSHLAVHKQRQQAMMQAQQMMGTPPQGAGPQEQMPQ